MTPTGESQSTLWRVGYHLDPTAFTPRDLYEYNHRFDYAAPAAESGQRQRVAHGALANAEILMREVAVHRGQQLLFHGPAEVVDQQQEVIPIAGGASGQNLHSGQMLWRRHHDDQVRVLKYRLPTLGRGCGRIVLTSRSQPNPQSQKMIDRLRSNGADIVVECGNIAEPETAARLVRAATASGLPLRGVLHAAAVVDDATLENITDELIERDWAPKVAGAWYPHQATTQEPLDWFCSFSSAAVLLGSPGQGAYAAANSWLDAFTSWQRSQGVPASAVAWGAWADIGRGAGVAQRGDVTMISPENGGYAFRALLRHDRGCTGYLPLTGMPLLTALAARSPFAEAFLDSVGHRGAGVPTVLAELVALEPDEWPNRLRRLVTDQAGLILRRAIDPDRSFTDHGLDSLGTLELRTHIETQTGVRITPKTIVTYNTARTLAGHLSETLAAESG